MTNVSFVDANIDGISLNYAVYALLSSVDSFHTSSVCPTSAQEFNLHAPTGRKNFSPDRSPANAMSNRSMVVLVAITLICVVSS